MSGDTIPTPRQLEIVGPPPQACRDQLLTIVRNSFFSGSDRDRKFLEYIVEEALAGRGDRIKAFSVAVEVFGRDASFDPQSDPIVRVRAGHLRRALERYYEGPGRTDPIVISIPKGGYVPTFVRHAHMGDLATLEPAAAAPEIAPLKTGLFTRTRSIAWPLCAVTALIALAAPFAAQKLSALATAQVHGLAPDLPRLLVRPLDDLGGASSSASVAKGLTQEIAGQIAKFKDIVVIEPGSESDPKADVAAPSVTFPARYVLAGSIALSESSLRLQVRVLDQTDGAILWADSYYGDLKVGQLLQIETELARKVATTLGQPYGVIFRADASRNFVSPPEDWEAYFCTLKYYTYRVNLDAATHSSVRKCLERAVERYPAYATAWALLSLTYLDEIRFHYPVDPSASPASIDRILTAARRAVELDPQNVRALQAEMFALYFHGDLQAALKVGEQAMALNPNDTELMGEYGYRLAASGDRARGCELLAQAREQNPSARGYYESGLAPCAYFRADF